MFHLLSLLATILTGLRAAVAQVAPRGRARTPVVTPPWDHLDHMFACFERLYADWRNGTLPEPREHADLPGTDTARLSRPVRVLPDTTMPDTTLPDTTMTASRTPTPPPSSSPHPPLPAPCAHPAGSPASPCCPRNARAPPPRETPLTRRADARPNCYDLASISQVQNRLV